MRVANKRMLFWQLGAGVGDKGRHSRNYLLKSGLLEPKQAEALREPSSLAQKDYYYEKLEPLWASLIAEIACEVFIKILRH